MRCRTSVTSSRVLRPARRRSRRDDRNPGRGSGIGRPAKPVARQWRRLAVVLAIMLLLFGVPWWTLLAAGAQWPTACLRDRHAAVRRGLRRIAAC